jgi:hypothetical protein
MGTSSLVPDAALVVPVTSRQVWNCCAIFGDIQGPRADGAAGGSATLWGHQSSPTQTLLGNPPRDHRSGGLIAAIGYRKYFL